MALPFFYAHDLPTNSDDFVLDEANSRHAVQVLRLQVGESVKVTDGCGQLCEATLTDSHKKHAAVTIISRQQLPRPARAITIAVSPVKNTSRFEWFFEKATELGVTTIVPLICTRTEKQHFKEERMRGILISAMLQSQQAFLPQLSAPIKFTGFVSREKNASTVYCLAHCLPAEKKSLVDLISESPIDKFSALEICIGPEGDFTPEEVKVAIEEGYRPVSLGDTRLRTETAAVTAAVIGCLI